MKLMWPVCLFGLVAIGARAELTVLVPPLVPRSVLKLIIDHPALAGYLHPDAPGRVPLIVSDWLLAPGVTPSKFGKPVLIVPDKQVGSRPHLRFVNFEVHGFEAKATIEYRVEGVVGVFTLSSTPSGFWKVVDAHVSEN